MLTGKNNFRSGLLGRTLKHSHSPAIHAMLGDHSYKLFEVEEDKVGEFLESGFDGINVTIPYKKTVMPYLHGISEEARVIGSVNTVVRKNGKLYGYNTDIYGFEMTLARAGISFGGKKILVLGSGGAAQTVLYAAKKHGGTAHTVSRNGELNYKNVLMLHSDADIIVNTTPVGMYPDNGSSPLSLEGFDRLEAVVDLIYNPYRTAILLDAERRGIKAVSCLDMLFFQAVRACELFFDEQIDENEAEKLYRSFKADKLNITLVGMPGSGKSTVGKLLAEKLGRKFVDTDEIIEAENGMTCSELIEKYGEAEFRRRETEAVKKAGAMTNAVIATGGGVVTIKENTDLLRQNSRIYFLDRDLCELPTDGRPLSNLYGVGALYEKRLPLYRALSDCAVKVCGAENTAEIIVKEHYREDTCY
ncbi:MAG: hypothetical protein IJN63_01305 [Clostridia bacterium]|nr:hypothetical protein [Clostridia bacterium]